MEEDLIRDALRSVIPRSARLESMTGKIRGPMPATRPDTGERLHTGTTILAFPFEGGLMFAADRKTSGGYLSIVSQETVKIHTLSGFHLIGGAGTVGDIQFILNILREVSEGFISKYDVPLSTEGHANYLSNVMRNFCFNVFPWGLEAHILLGGFDITGEFEIYEVWMDGGQRKLKYGAIGSGSDGALSVLRENKNVLEGGKLKFNEALDIAAKSIYRAGEVDNGTSDIRVAVPTVAKVTFDGADFVSEELVSQAVKKLVEGEKSNG